jgi:hypothetical protein
MSKNLNKFFRDRQVDNTSLDNRLRTVQRGSLTRIDFDDDEDEDGVEAKEPEVVALPEETEAESTETVQEEAPVEETKE